MWGFLKKNRESQLAVVEIQDMNVWRLKGRIGSLAKERNGSSFQLTTRKTLFSGEEKRIHHRVKLNSMLTDEYFDDLQEGMTVQVEGEMFYGSRPMNMAKSLGVIC